jgi:hypothetical protein
MTPIEDRADWAVHREARDASQKRGLCWWCAEKVGFAAVEKAHGTPSLLPPELCPPCAAIEAGRST